MLNHFCFKYTYKHVREEDNETPFWTCMVKHAYAWINLSKILTSAFMFCERLIVLRIILRFYSAKFCF